jgi:AcrR family transcriptional regulator
VAERAGVSRGAHLHHFQTRSALVSAAVERLAERRHAELTASADDLPAGRDGVLRGLDLLWGSYATPLFQGALSLWAHARTDPELRERLEDVERAFDRQTLEVARRLFPAAADRADFTGVLEMAVATMRGLSLLETLRPGSGRNARQWEFSRERLADLLVG